MGCYDVEATPANDNKDEDVVLDPDDNGLLDNPQTKPFREALIKASPTRKERRKWQRNLIIGSPDAWVAILFFLVPNLRFLKLDHSTGSKVWSTLALSRIATGVIDFQFNPLQYLEEVVMSENTVFTFRPHWEFIPYFHFPGVRFFYAHAITDIFEARSVTTCPALQPPLQTSGITELVLSLVHGRTGVIRYIAACANLQVFKYEHTQDDMAGGFPAWSPLYLYRALMAQKHSLQELYIGYWAFEGGSFAEVYSLLVSRPRLWSFGSLVEFTHLREIDLPVVFLLGYSAERVRPTLNLVEKLPCSVERLCLSEILDRDVDIIAKALCYMLSARTTQFLSLQGIELCFLNMAPGGRHGFWFAHVLHAFAGVQEMCDAVGIELVYSSYMESRPKLAPGRLGRGRA